MIKYILLIIEIFFIGCSNINYSSTPELYKSKINKYNSAKLVDDTEYNSIYEKITDAEDEFFLPHPKSINLDLTNEDFEKFDKPKNYNTIPIVYKNIVNGNSLENYNLKGSDYLTLYKMLYINQPKLFIKLKIKIIDAFMLETEDYFNLDFKYISKVLLNENFTKINKLKKQIIKLEKENR